MTSNIFLKKKKRVVLVGDVADFSTAEELMSRSGRQRSTVLLNPHVNFICLLPVVIHRYM